MDEEMLMKIPIWNKLPDKTKNKAMRILKELAEDSPFAFSYVDVSAFDEDEIEAPKASYKLRDSKVSFEEWNAQKEIYDAAQDEFVEKFTNKVINDLVKNFGICGIAINSPPAGLFVMEFDPKTEDWSKIDEVKEGHKEILRAKRKYEKLNNPRIVACELNCSWHRPFGRIVMEPQKAVP